MYCSSYLFIHSLQSHLSWLSLDQSIYYSHILIYTFTGSSCYVVQRIFELSLPATLVCCVRVLGRLSHSYLSRLFHIILVNPSFPFHWSRFAPHISYFLAFIFTNMFWDVTTWFVGVWIWAKSNFRQVKWDFFISVEEASSHCAAAADSDFPGKLIRITFLMRKLQQMKLW